MFFLVVGFITLVDQSWAMGKRGGPGSGKKFGNSSYSENQSQGSSFVDLDENTNETSNNEENSNQENSSNEKQSFYDEHAFSDDEFPASTTVPEPATLSLVGMGLAGLLLRKRKQ